MFVYYADCRCSPQAYKSGFDKFLFVGIFILWTETGTLILARPHPDRYEELARVNVLGSNVMCWPAPALFGKRLIVRDHKRAVCLYLGPASELDPARPTLTLTAANRRFEWTRLVPKEPEYANDAPQVGEIAVWFVWSVGIIAMAAAFGFPIRTLSPRCNPFVVVLALAFGLGAAGTTAIGATLDTFAWTWPVSLYMAFRGVLALGLDRTKTGWRHQIKTRLALDFFIGLCFGYYRICLAVGYAMAWGFLGGFVPALPITVQANRTANGKLRWMLEVLSFVVYFWVSSLIPSWKAAWGDS